MLEVEVLLKGYAAMTNRGILGFCSIVLLTGEKNVIFDTGHWMDRPMLKETLRKRDIDPAKIDAVILSHLHADHIMNVDLFPNADIILSAQEMAYAKNPNPDDEWLPYFWEAILEGRNIVTIEQEGEWEEMPEISFLILPGHTPGCLAVVTKTKDGTVVLSGDAGKYAKEFLTKRKFDSMIYGDVSDVKKSIERILKTADIIIPGHDRPLKVVDHEYVMWEENTGLEIIMY